MRNFMLPEKAIEQFKKLYVKNYGIELTNEDASRKANNLVELYKAIYGNAYFGRIKNNEKDNGSDTTTLSQGENDN